MPMLDLEPAAREMARLVDGVSDDQLTDPTPNEGTQVAGLLNHLMRFSLAFTWAARKTPRPAGTPGGGIDDPASLDPGWRTVLPERLDELARAWKDPQAWEGMSEAGGVTMPGEVTGLVALDELVLHGWDLAKATGQSFSCDPASAEAILSFTKASAQPDGSLAGLFGPVVEVPADASTFERALGFAGRDPAWSPPATA